MKLALAWILFIASIAWGQTLAPVQTAAGGVDWWIFGPLIVVLVIVGAFFYLRKKNPAAAALATATVNADMQALAADLRAWAKSVEARLSQPPAAPADAAVAVPVPVPAPVPGKAGQAGTFTIPVTGDPATDLTAMMTQYNAK